MEQRAQKVDSVMLKKINKRVAIFSFVLSYLISYELYFATQYFSSEINNSLLDFLINGIFNLYVLSAAVLLFVFFYIPYSRKNLSNYQFARVYLFTQAMSALIILFEFLIA